MQNWRKSLFQCTFLGFWNEFPVLWDTQVLIHGLNEVQESVLWVFLVLMCGILCLFFYQYCLVIVWIVKSMIRNGNQFCLQFFKVCLNPVVIMLNAWNWVQKLGQESDCNVFSLVCMINFMFAEVPSLWFYQYYSFLVGVHNYMTREWKQFCLWFCLYTLIYQSWSKPCGNYELKIEGGVYCPVFSLVCTINFVGIFLIPCSDWQFHDKG